MADDRKITQDRVLALDQVMGDDYDNHNDECDDGRYQQRILLNLLFVARTILERRTPPRLRTN
jgi:hypothetical protein